jgi:hypothetical protein
VSFPVLTDNCFDCGVVATLSLSALYPIDIKTVFFGGIVSAALTINAGLS